MNDKTTNGLTLEEAQLIVERAKKDYSEAINDAKKTNEIAYDLIEKNNFHLFMFISAGGKLKERKA